MEVSEDGAATSVNDENPPAESSSFPDLSVHSRLTEFASESRVNGIRTCLVRRATTGTIAAGQSSALFTTSAVKHVLRACTMQSLLDRQPGFQSSPRSSFSNEHASSNSQSSSLFAVDTAGKSHELSDSSWMVPKENDRSPSTNWEDVNATQSLKAVNPSLPDNNSPFDMQTLLTSLANFPENVQHQVMRKLYMLCDFRDRANALKGIPEALSSARAGGTKFDSSVTAVLAAYSTSNSERTMDVTNGQDSGNQSGNDSECGEVIEVSTGQQLTPLAKYEKDEKCLMIDFPFRRDDSYLALQLNNKCSISDEPHLPSSNTSHRVHSLHSSELHNNRSSDEMHVQLGNLHLSNNANKQATEEKCDLTIANRNNSLALSVTELHRMYLGEPLHICPVCKIAFRYTSMLKVHAKIRHNETHPFPCTVCEQKFDRYLTLTQHMYSHGVSPTYKCEICGETFNYQSRLIRHNRLAHYEIFGLTRPSRHMMYLVTAAKERKLQREMAAARSNSVVLSSRTEPSTSITPEHCRDEQLFPCVFCGKKFSKKALLSQHMKSHEFSSTYECETCGQAFNFQSSLAKHRSSVHSDTVRHDCSVCDMTFSNQNNLKRHQATHLNSTGVNLQSTSQRCFRLKKMACASPSSRTEPNPTAMSRRGLGKEFACTFCDKSFDKETMLSEHMKSHEWRPSYKCEICGETFNFQSSLMKHQHSVHSDLVLGHTSPPGLSSSY